MLVQEFLRRSAALRPQATALVCGERRFTYERLEASANRLAGALAGKGVRRGDRVALYLDNSPECVIGIFAALKAGAAFVAISRGAKPDKLLAILNDCSASAVILDVAALGQGLLERLPEEAPSLRTVVACGGAPRPSDPLLLDFAAVQASFPDQVPAVRAIDLDLACLIYTSGTTGESKGVMCDHGNMVFAAETIARYLKHSERDVVLSVLPLAFSYGLYQLLATFAAGGTLVLEESFAFPELVLERMAREGATGFAAVPSIFARLLSMDLNGVDLSALRYLTNAAAGLPVEQVRSVRLLFPGAELYLMHGLTEVARTMYLPPDQVDARPASSGLPLDGTELWLEDEEGRRLGPGEAGELIVRGRHVMRGYWGAPELSARRFRPGALPGERVCCSGDLFYTDAQGYYYFVSRKDDMIKSRGRKVAPREAEDILYRIPGVLEAAVIGIPHPELGQAVKAFIVAPGAGLIEAAVIAHCRKHMEEFMVPRAVEFVTELPKTASGKLRRMDLR
ncbi:MAG: AMP-binding protein [Elusimicrobiota bacterium]|nr:AMP-binding protein [Elusimicrobiota bacterium]